MTETPLTQDAWQARLDSQFPYGLALGRSAPSPRTLPVAWVQVAGMAGEDPLLTLWPADLDRMPWFEMELTGWRELQVSPVLLVRVTFATNEHPMLWTAISATEPLARKIDPWRRYWKARAAGQQPSPPGSEAA